jgi:hypothetical protein
MEQLGIYLVVHLQFFTEGLFMGLGFWTSYRIVRRFARH